MKNYLNELIICVIEDMIEVISYLNPVVVIIFLLILTGLFAAGKRLDRTGVYMKRIFKVVLSLGYGLILFMITLFSREAGSRTRLDLLPLATLGGGAAMDAYVVENVLLFIPLGILVAYSFPRVKERWKVISIGFIVSLLIEVVQYLSGCGYAQTDDLITNTIGTWVGLEMFRIVHISIAAAVKMED